MKVATFTLRADVRQSAAWKQAAEREGFASVGAWAGGALEAYLRARARAGRPLPLSWHRGCFSVLLMDGRTVEARGSVSPPFGHFQGSSTGPGRSKPRTLVCLATGRVIATLRSARQCRELAAELAPVWIRDRDLAAGIVDRHVRRAASRAGRLHPGAGPCYHGIMPKRPRRPRDPNELAHAVFLEAIGEAPPCEPEREKNPAAVALGKLGGAKGGKARAEKMTPKERAESARKAARARWSK